MDRMSGGGAPDGPFERFLTAALATIITIMFSWRLLHEENEASGARERSNSPVSSEFQYYKTARSRYKKLSSHRSSGSESSMGNHYDISLDELDDDTDTESNVNKTNLSLSDSSVRETVTGDRVDPTVGPSLGASPPSRAEVGTPNSSPITLSSGNETLTTWDDYDWKEETGQEQEFVIKTRRSLRDFAKPKPNPSPHHMSASEGKSSTLTTPSINPVINSDVQMEAGINVQASSPYLSFSQRMANFEYSDTGGDSGYVDLYPDVDTDESEEESSDEEHEYEIQVSDSDSDSPDERTSNSFFGVTGLDTIFEEFESDLEDEEICDKGVLQVSINVSDRGGYSSDKDELSNDKGDMGPFGDKTGRYAPHIPSHREVNIDNGETNDKTDIKQTEFMSNDNLNSSAQVQYKLPQPAQEIYKQQVMSQLETETSLSFTHNAGDKFKPDSEYALHDVDRKVLSQVERSEYNLSSNALPVTDDKINPNKILDSCQSENSEPIDCIVNNTGSLNSGISHQNIPKGNEVTGHLSNIKRLDHMTVKGVTQQDTENNASQSNSPVSPLQIEFSKLQERMKISRLSQLQKDTPASELSEESQPSSPVRNAALDNIVDDKFSDTESCSSESVITVISVKSTESDHYPVERQDLTRDSCITPVHINVNMASGTSDQLAHINMSDSSYEHNSLVSGFLNDSLNSLLSANNINDMEEHSDVDISEIEIEQDLENGGLLESVDSKLSLEEKIQPVDDTGEQSENSSKTSSADSLSLVLARVQETNQINTELSNQAANKTGLDEFRIESRISDALQSRDIRILDEREVSERFLDSDSSSDSSDPPLREYDPDDDDLAAFQFNQDIDNDSFYLLVGDEGSLRNYETFTNLNSIGLSSEYNDAFTSRAFPDEARGFTFSRTEDLGTQCRTQGYFTERERVSDGDSQSDKGLSPIVSEDEEITCLPETEPLYSKPLQSEQMGQVTEVQSNSHLSQRYKDAELSGVHTYGPLTELTDKTEQKSIDFQKYIIQPERKPSVTDTGDQEGSDSQNGDKDSRKIDEEFIETKGPEIDKDQCTIDRSGVNSVNNTVGTNNSDVPQTKQTETPEISLTRNVHAVPNELDLDKHIHGDSGQTGELISVDRDISRVASHENIGKEAKFENKDIPFTNDKFNVHGADLTYKHVKIETNVDDCFSENVDRNANIKTFPQSEQSQHFEHSKENVNITPRETCIDDLFVDDDTIDTNSENKQGLIEPVGVTLVNASPRETCIDDIFVENGESTVKTGLQSVSQTESLQYRPSIETTFDEKPTTNETINHQGNRNKSKETNIDDIFETEITPIKQKDAYRTIKRGRFTPSRSKETNIDDLFDDTAVPAKVSPVQSTPLKNTPAIETNVDDVISHSIHVSPENKRSHRKSVETYVDDLFSDLYPDENRQTDKKSEIPQKKQDKLSYETFVDDLFSEVLTPDDKCSSLSVGSNVQSSESAINQRYSSNVEASSNLGAPISVHKDVSPTVYKEQHSQPDNFECSSPGLIEHEKETNKVNDPSSEFNYGPRSLSPTDNTGKDLDSDKDRLNVSTPVSIVECQNTQSIQSDPSTAKLRDQEILVTDNIEPKICTNTSRDVFSLPQSNDRNNSDTVETIITRNDIISTENNTENNEVLVKSKTENERPINDPSNNTELSVYSNYDELNGQKPSVIDYNANVSLPKSGGLNIVTNNDNRKDLGLHPAQHNRAKTSLYDLEPTDIQTESEVELNQSEEQSGITNENDIVLKIVEDSELPVSESDITNPDQDTFSSIGSCSINSDDDSLNSIEESYNNLQSTYNSSRRRGLSDSSIGRVDRSPVIKPTTIFAKSTDHKYQGVKRRIHKQQLKKYTSILQQPFTAESQRLQLQDVTPEKPISVTRLKVLQSRQRFLSEENLSNSSFEERFLQYRTTLGSSTPRKYLKRHERALAAELQSTESLPADMSAMDYLNSSYGSYNSMDRIHSLPVSRQIEELYNSRYSSANSSFERHDYDKLHKNCIFSPEKREEIRHTTKSLENMFEQLLRYGSVSSLAETDLDAAAAAQNGSFPPDIDISDYVSFQYPLERAASMSALTGSSDGHRLPRKPGKGRFASRNVPKSKSLQTLETNLDDVFADEHEFGGGELKKTPSVHELRVSKSLSKLNVPDWFRKSSFSRSGSTQSLFTYASRQGSTSTLGSSVYPASITTSPSPSVTPGSNAIIINKRVTAAPSTPSTAKLLRAPLLPTTPEKAPIHNTPPAVILPSDRFRKADKKELKPIAIVPFAKLREMFEKKAQENTQAKSPVTSPTKEKPPSKVRFEPASPVSESSFATATSPKRETVINDEPVQNNRTISPRPPVPERKPILADSSRKSESAPSNTQPRRMQVHFSDEKQPSEQKRRYSSILENGFAEQLEELQDRDAAFNFPIVSIGKHSNGDIGSFERSPDLQVVLTNAYTNNSAPYDYMNSKLRNDASMDDILDGLLLLDGHRTGRLRMDEHGRIVPKHPEDFSPDTPPGFSVNSGGNSVRDTCVYGNGVVYDGADLEYMLVKCEKPDCKRETNLKEAKLYFKTCHSCYTYYCSRQCRKDDWDLHKKVCIYSRINSACKHVIKFINRQPELQYQCSRIARRGYLAQGRGCVMFAFPDISSSEDFLYYGFESLWVPPVYVSLRELPNASMLGSKLEVLTDTCQHYNPELKYVIHVAIVIPPKLPVRPMPRRIESIIQKSAKLRLSPAHMHPRQENNTDIPSTLILTAVPGNQHADDPDGRKTRELCFINIQRKLRQRGVSLRHQFPDVYNKLIDFVSDAKHFTPMIIYPSDGRTGRKFMCVIMPESEPEIEWIRDPNLFHELDVFEEEEFSTPNLSLNLQEVLL